MIVYVGIPNKLFLTNQNTPRTIECSKVSAYKINIDNLITFLYTGDEHVEAKTKNIIPFTITSKKKKYLVINLAKCVQDLYSKPWTKFHTLYRNWLKEIIFLNIKCKTIEKNQRENLEDWGLNKEFLDLTSKA